MGYKSPYLILLPFFWGHIVGAIIYGLGWRAQSHVSMGSIFDVAEKIDHVTQPVHQPGSQLPYDDASEEDNHQRQPCEIAHSGRFHETVWQSRQRALANRDLLCPIIKAAGFPAPVGSSCWHARHQDRRSTLYSEPGFRSQPSCSWPRS